VVEQICHLSVWNTYYNYKYVAMRLLLLSQKGATPS
jgi:hypothetical protein